MGNRSLTWKKTSENDKPSNVDWSFDGFVVKTTDSFEEYLKKQFIEDIMFRFYKDDLNKSYVLQDFKNDTKYLLPYDGTSRGYILAYKLFVKNID